MTPFFALETRFRKYILANREGISVILILSALPTVFRHRGRPVNDSFTPLRISTSYLADRSLANHVFIAKSIKTMGLPP